MELTVGAILEGKVKSITNFGAFIALPNNLTGLVHISEVANTYVSNVRDHLTEGQDVKVMVLSSENGKINLSIKKAAAPARPARPAAPAQNASRPSAGSNGGNQSFDDMLKRFMADSDSKISGLKQYSDHKTKTRRR